MRGFDGGPPDDMVDAANRFHDLLGHLRRRAEYHRRRQDEQEWDESYAHGKVAKEIESIIGQYTEPPIPAAGGEVSDD